MHRPWDLCLPQQSTEQSHQTDLGIGWTSFHCQLCKGLQHEWCEGVVIHTQKEWEEVEDLEGVGEPKEDQRRLQLGAAEVTELQLRWKSWQA
jgi:hypothetical protein